MADEKEDALPRAAVVVYTADGKRIKPACPMCGRVYWGKLYPPEVSHDTPVHPYIPVRVGNDGQQMGMAYQLWTCMNCGFLWHRTGGVEPKDEK